MIAYEWVIETLDSNGDITDTHAESVLKNHNPPARYELALTKSVSDKFRETCEEHTHAYVVDGRLPDTFDNGDKVPMRFHAELLRSKA